MRSPIDQIVEFKSPNLYTGLMMEHVTGPMKGTSIKFSVVQARKARIKGLVCTCDAYTYPHNKGTGKCQEQK
jgi:hypothetical protein